MDDKISIEQFKSVEIKIGRILTAEKVPETDKLIHLTVDMGEVEPRHIVSGIALHFPDPAALIGKRCAFVANLAPRSLKGIESNGMILAASTPDGQFSLFEVGADIPPGTRVG